MLFNAVCMAFALVLLLPVSTINGFPSIYTLVMGIAFGIVTVLSQHVFTLALQTGPLSFSTLFQSFSLVLPTLGGVVIWQESITPWQVIGLVLLVISFVLIANPKADASVTGRWLFYGVLSFLLSGVFGLIQKFHQSSSHKHELDEFLIVAFMTAALCFLLLFIRNRRLKGIPLSFSMKSKVLVMAALCGICLGACNKLSLYLIGVMPSVIFFPLVNGGNVVCSALVALIVFRERPRPV